MVTPTVDRDPREAAPLPAHDADVVIRVRNVGKMYRIYDRPQDRLKHMLLWRFGKHYGREFWALRGVSFEVRRGETVGIIGRNGSGKSTLLQIIAGTLAPTEGEAQVKGRVAALLELGSGFNPEFTGRENVYLNGAILGLSRDEIDARFDEIAAFADIGEFIDQPVKVYSSGMAVRLAFAVQVMVPKDILIIDEALAVGDEAFQRKCMRALEMFRLQGGTVLLVTHNTQAIIAHCMRSILIWNGEMLLDGRPKHVTDLYQRLIYSPSTTQHELISHLRSLPLAERAVAGLDSEPKYVQFVSPSMLVEEYDHTIPQTQEMSYGGKHARITDYGMYDQAGRKTSILRVGDSYAWKYIVEFYTTAYNINFGMMIKTVEGVEVASMNSDISGEYLRAVDKGSIVEVQFDFFANLVPGTYYVNAGVLGVTDEDFEKPFYLHRRVDVCAIRVVSTRSQYYNRGIAYIDPVMKVAFSSK
ncbi:ABC transporter ATP-binding protein [Roseiflexus sp.]|uniref:ABC transporter ATP-binding protein n=1 Tax=Roseiflexus sp. TaxID=2562120 RepID=UPI00398AB414